MELLRRWRERENSPGSMAGGDRATAFRSDFPRFAAEIEEWLQEIDFEEVTTEDRITFVEAAVAWRVRRALWAGRFDLAVELQRFGAERVAQLYEERHGWRPVLLYGVPRPITGES